MKYLHELYSEPEIKKSNQVAVRLDMPEEIWHLWQCENDEVPVLIAHDMPLIYNGQVGINISKSQYIKFEGVMK